ncbi:hypothetical protein FSARC_2055 [Fusarium sarcochroum]|uniref:Uncharacterized protein n=1 Tax=Fusarium sarcochroum TaxID=1208366 RepID=A0A8H4XDG0_9HYPO|nr:hypothetical protein FSARC_2055 [Fusarium sarcochroum]
MCGFPWSRRSSTYVSDLWFKFLNFITHLCGDNESSHAAELANTNNEPANADQVNSWAPSESSSSSWTTITYESEPAPVIETPAQRIQKWVEGISSGPPSSRSRKVQRVQNWVEGISSGPPNSAGEAPQASGQQQANCG